MIGAGNVWVVGGSTLKQTAQISSFKNKTEEMYMKINKHKLVHFTGL